MSSGGWQEYVTVFGGAAALSLFLTPLMMRLAVRLHVLDRPGENKSHDFPVPYLGGLAIVFAFAVAVTGAAVVRPPVGGRDELVLVLGVAVVLSLVGLLDDLRGLGPVFRLLVEVAGGVAIWTAGVGTELFPIEPLNAVFTVAWVVGVTNAFNLLDNMDGLSAGVAAIAAGWIFIIAAANDQFLVAALAAGLAGCALGFLRHNFHPARIYMGDAGSLFLGFLLAYLGLKLRFPGPTQVTFLVPILVVGVAIADTALVTWCRLRVGKSPFQGGLDHMSHRLVFMGIPVPISVALIYGASIGLGGIAFVVSRIDRLSAYVLAGLVVAGGLFLLVLLSRVPVYRGQGVSWDVDEERGEASDAAAGEGNGAEIRNRQARLGSLFATERRDP